jgi:hypothetical protein
MLNRLVLLLLAAVLAVGATACKKKQTTAEKRAEEVKAFRVRQKQMAAKAYQDIITKYPDSEFAAQAKERLQALGPVAETPKKK